MFDLDYTRKYLKVALSSWTDSELFEDAVQEGLIRAWKDIEDGKAESQAHLNHRAKIWAFNFIKDAPSGRRTATGAPRRSNEGQTKNGGERTREKISQCIREYYELHREEPTNKQIAQSTGISASLVSSQRKNIREGRSQSHAIYSEQYGERRRDTSAYSFSHFDTAHVEDVLLNLAARVDWERTTVSDLDFHNLLSKVDEPHRSVLYWHYAIGYNAKEIAQLLGYGANSNVGGRRIRAAHEEARAILDPDYTAPKKRAYPVQRKRVAPRGYKREVATHCGKSHEIRGYRPATGKRYCKICNNLRQHPGKTEMDIPEASKLWNWDKR